MHGSIVSLPGFLPPVPVTTALAETVDWSLSTSGIPDLWKLTEGEGIKVAILDTGADMNHPDLRDAIDDAKDFTNSRFGEADRNGHGCWCAGMVGARRNDGGMIGVAPKCRLLIGKVLGDGGSGGSDAVAAGIDWALSSGADIISMSLGSRQPDPWIKAANQRAAKAGKFVFCAAGNDGSTNAVGYPAAWDFNIAVTAVGKNGRPAPFASLGKEADIAAWGVDMISCAPGGGYQSMSGSSMATPWVAGVAALLLARHRKLGHNSKSPLETTGQMIEHLRRGAVDVGQAQSGSYAGALIKPETIIAGEGEGDSKPAPINGEPRLIQQIGSFGLYMPARPADALQFSLSIGIVAQS